MAPQPRMWNPGDAGNVFVHVILSDASAPAGGGLRRSLELVFILSFIGCRMRRR